MSKTVYWEQRTNSISNFFAVLSGIASAIVFRSFVMIFIAGVLGLVGGVKWFGILLGVCLSILLYLFLSEQFVNIITQTTLKYSIDEEGVNFHYWFGYDHTLSIPYKNILSIHSIRIGNKISTDRLYLHVSPIIDLSKLQAFTDGEINLLCLDDLDDIEYVKSILIPKISESDQADFFLPKGEHRAITTSKLSFLMNSFALAYLFIGFFFFLSNLDRYVLAPVQIKDTISSIEPLYYQNENTNYGMRLTTMNGHRIDVDRAGEILDHEVILKLSPILNNVTSISSDTYTLLDKSNDDGLRHIAEILCSFVLLFCSVYIVRKNGDLPLQDTLFFILFPMVLLFIVAYILRL